MENKLGAQLLNRTTRQVALTEVGASYLQSCRLIIAELDKANSEARTASGSVKGMLRIGAPDWLCAPTCGTTFANFSRKISAPIGGITKRRK